MRNWIGTCILLLMVLSLIMINPVYSNAAQSNVGAAASSEPDPPSRHHIEHLTFHVAAGNSMAIVSSRGLTDVNAYIHIDVKPGERYVLSSEEYNLETLQWEPEYVKLFDQSYDGWVAYEGDHYLDHRYVLTGYHIQSSVKQHMTVTYIV